MRETGVPASKHLQIKDEADALSFNLAAALRLLRFDNEKEAANKKFWRRLVLGSEAVPDDDILDSPTIGNDPYADASTMSW